MIKKIVVNGKILLNGISGVERSSWEILKCWDRIVKDYQNLDIEVVIPKRCKQQVDVFNNIKIFEYGNANNLTLWQQFILPQYLRRTHGKYVGLANSAPFMINDGFVLLHDINPLVNKNFYSKKARLKFFLETKHIINGNFKLATVSHFSAREIADKFNINVDDIFVIGNGYEHMLGIENDNSIFNSYQCLAKGDYYFSLSSLAPNKNLKWILDTARLNPNSVFVIAGGCKKEIYGNSNFDVPENVLMLGRISDAKAKSLLSNCKAFLFPSFYEGFGIPPLEALACNVPSVVADNEVMHEIYGDAVTYINNKIPCKNIDGLNLQDAKVNKQVLRRHSWTVYGRKLLDYIILNIDKMD